MFQKFYEFNVSSIFYKMRENFPSMRVSVRMYQIACVSRRMRETWKVCRNLGNMLHQDARNDSSINLGASFHSRHNDLVMQKTNFKMGDFETLVLCISLNLC